MTSQALNRPVDVLAQEIRRVDGNHSLGAGALAEALMPFIEREFVSHLAVKARNWDDLMAARIKTKADRDDSHWKRVAREQGLMAGIKACRGDHGLSLTEARDCVEAYLAAIGSQP